MTKLKLKHVNKHYTVPAQDDFHALEDITLSFESGELVAIVGESGSGKSTLLNLLGGLDSDFTGEIIVDGKNIGEFSEKELVRYHKEKVGFIFQNAHVIPHLSVLDNVMLSMTLSNVDKVTRKERAVETLKQVGLEKHLTKKPNQLSGGQKQRVAIARALVNDPDIIIADEPTGSLDSKTTRQILAIIESIAKCGKLVLIVTHSEQVAQRCSRIVTIADGVILSDERKEKNPSLKGENQFAFEERPKNRNLSFLSALQLAWKNMKEKWLRNLLITLGGSIGIMSIILMLSLGEGVNGYLIQSMTSQINPLVTEVHMPKEGRQSEADPTAIGPLASQGGVTGLAKDIIIQDPAFASENIEELQQLEGVEAIESGFQSTRLGGNSLVLDGESYSFMNLSSVSNAITEANIQEGRLPEQGELMVTERFAEQLAQPVGKAVTLTTVLNGTKVRGDYVISGVFSSGSNLSPNALTDGVYMNYEDIQALAESQGIALAPNVLYLLADNPETTADVQEQIRQLGYTQSTTDVIANLFGQMIDMFTYVLAGVAGISLVVSAILIATVLFISVVERTNEIGIIKAIGGRHKDVRRIFVSEAFLIGLFSGIVAVGTATLIAYGINSLTKVYFDTAILIVKPEYAGAGMIVSILISVCAGLLPAARAARMDPVDSLRYE